MLSTEKNEDEKEVENSQNEFYIPPGMPTEDFERYAAVDEDLSTEAEISESAIVNALQQSEDQLTENRR